MLIKAKATAYKANRKVSEGEARSMDNEHDASYAGGAAIRQAMSEARKLGYDARELMFTVEYVND